MNANHSRLKSKHDAVLLCLELLCIDAPVGIGANTAIFSFVDGVLLKPLPYANAGRMVRVLGKPPGGPDARNGISTLNFLDWQRQNSVFHAVRVNGVSQELVESPGQPLPPVAAQNRRTAFTATYRAATTGSGAR